jgi:hypothetical protein
MMALRVAFDIESVQSGVPPSCPVWASAGPRPLPHYTAPQFLEPLAVRQAFFPPPILLSLTPA